MTLNTHPIASLDSWIVQTDEVELAVSRLGGMMAPVTFFRNSKESVQPYFVNPWHAEGLAIDEPVLVPLRGDFFCMPFGAAGTHSGIDFPTHGEPATKEWGNAALAKEGKLTLFSASMKTSLQKGSIAKRIWLKEGENTLYIQHELSGYHCITSLGHHATLAPGAENGSMNISTSPIKFAMTTPRSPGPTLGGEYYALPPGVHFERLSAIPTIWKDPSWTDCSVFPMREGFDDVIGLCAEPSQDDEGATLPAWTAAVFPEKGFVWFSLKDPEVLPTTVVWMENKGRHQSPWQGRTTCIGLEEVCGFLARPVSEAVDSNAFTSHGVKSAHTLTPAVPLKINAIQGVARVPRDFHRVAEVRFGSGEITMISNSGKSVSVAVGHDFIATGAMQSEGH